MTDPEEELALRAVALRTEAIVRIARERADEELRSAREHLEAEKRELAHAQALAKIGSWTIDFQRRTQVWSDETYRLFGMRAEQGGASYASFLERVHPDDRELVAATFDLSVRREQPFMCEHRVLLADGALKWVQQRCEFTYGDDGRLIRAAGTTQDVSERREAEDILRKSQQLMRIAGRAGRLGGWDLDLITQVVSWCDEVCAIHGVPPGYQPQLDEALNFYAPEHRDEISAAVSACSTNGTPFDLELQIINRSGNRIWVRAIGEARLDHSGRMIGLGGALQDISERVAAARSLRLSDERFRLVVQATTDVVWDWNLIEDTCWWSDGLQTKFGYPPGVSSSVQFWTDNIHPDDRAAVLERLKAAMDHDAIWADEYRFRRADGTYAQVSDRALLARDAAGRAHRMLGAMVDITQRRSLEARLARAQQLAALGQLAANMAHEFNNVLMGILPFAEVIARVTDDIPRNAATHILESVRRGKGVTAEILRFTGRLDPIDQPLDLHDWLLDLAADETGEEVPPEVDRTRPAISISTGLGLPRLVLIVDDEPSVVEGIAMLLESEGVESVSVFEGRSAMEAIERHDPDLVLLDIGLPDVSGVEVFTWIHERWPSRRVVLMTGHYSPLDIAAILELPNVGFLQKPFDVDELLMALVVASPTAAPAGDSRREA